MGESQETGVDAEKVIGRLAQQISSLHVELAVRDERIEQLEEEVRNMRTAVDAVALQHAADKEADNGSPKRKAGKSG